MTGRALIAAIAAGATAVAGCGSSEGGGGATAPGLRELDAAERAALRYAAAARKPERAAACRMMTRRFLERRYPDAPRPARACLAEDPRFPRVALATLRESEIEGEAATVVVDETPSSICVEGGDLMQVVTYRLRLVDERWRVDGVSRGDIHGSCDEPPDIEG